MKARGAAVAAGAVAVAGLWAGTRASPAFYSGYLAAFFFWLYAPLGALAWLCCFELTGGRWGLAARPALRAAAATLPWLTLMFVPVACGLGRLYPWTHQPVPSGPYLNAGWFLARAVLYFAIWNALARLCARAPFSAAGGWIVALCLTVTFSSVDWVMSFDSAWKSTIFGFIVWTGQGLTAMALCGLCIGLALRGRALDEEERVVLGDVGNLMLAAVMLWAYCEFSQYLIIWSGNIPAEAVWYVHRARGGWRWLASTGALAGLGLPFFFLLFRVIKRSPIGLAAVSLLVLALRGMETAWLVLPDAPGGLARIWLFLACAAALGAIWTPLFLGGLRGWMAAPAAAGSAT